MIMFKPAFYLRLAAVSGAIAVVLGAFGAHMLRDRLSEKSMAVFHTANQYHFYHTLALLAAGLLYSRKPDPRLLWSSAFFTAGILVFSGSLYTLAMAEQYRWLGMITPLGGVCFIIGWLMLLAGLRGKE
jgi:uncharacterized membrane protein YgdD (TMEM256/DUF423 family)